MSIGNEYTHKLSCPRCGNDMYVDDVDYNFEGCQNNYYVCPSCKLGAFEKIRYKKPCYIEYNDEEGNKYDPTQQYNKTLNLELTQQEAFILDEALKCLEEKLSSKQQPTELMTAFWIVQEKVHKLFDVEVK